MIRLENILIKNNCVKCDLFPEDSRENGNIEIDIETKEIITYLLPSGYEWCKKHIQHAKEYLLDVSLTNERIPDKKLLMWN